MIKLVDKSWNNITRAYELCYILSSTEDFDNLPTNEVSVGSMALCPVAKKIYMFTIDDIGDGKWIEYGKEGE